MSFFSSPYCTEHSKPIHHERRGYELTHSAHHVCPAIALHSSTLSAPPCCSDLACRRATPRSSCFFRWNISGWFVASEQVSDCPSNPYYTYTSFSAVRVRRGQGRRPGGPTNNQPRTRNQHPSKQQLQRLLDAASTKAIPRSSSSSSISFQPPRLSLACLPACLHLLLACGSRKPLPGRSRCGGTRSNTPTTILRRAVPVRR